MNQHLVMNNELKCKIEKWMKRLKFIICNKISAVYNFPNKNELEKYIKFCANRKGEIYQF